MSGVLILSVSAGQLAGPSDEAGQQVAQALLAHGLPGASRQVVDEDEPAVEAALRAGVGAYGLIVILGGGGGSAGEIVRRGLARVTRAAAHSERRAPGAAGGRPRPPGAAPPPRRAAYSERPAPGAAGGRPRPPGAPDAAPGGAAGAPPSGRGPLGEWARGARVGPGGPAPGP